MKSKIIVLLACAIAATACTNTGLFDSETSFAGRPVPTELSIGTRASVSDAMTVRDANVYLFDSSGNPVFHRYLTRSTTTVELLPGSYEAVVLGNLHEDLGERTLSELQTLRLDAERLDDPTALPLYDRRQVTISASSRQLSFSLRRRAARIDYTVRIAAEASGIELLSVQLRNLPRHAAALPDGRATDSSDPADYTDGPLIEAQSPHEHSGTLYLYPNRQGTVAGIVSQEQKGPDKAPACATHLLIRARRGTHLLTYFVYPGRDNTQNFDIDANRPYTLDIAIRGENTVDTRVMDCYAEVAEIRYAWDAYRDCGLYPGNKPLNWDIRIEAGSIQPLQVRCEVEGGTTDGVRINGQPTTDYVMPLSGPERNYVELTYDSGLLDDDNARLRIRISVEDRYGVALRTTEEVEYANEVAAYYKFSGQGLGKGSVQFVSSTRATATVNGGSYTYLGALVYPGSCTVEAVPEAGSRFTGWYSNTTCRPSEKLSSSTRYTFTVNKASTMLFARFE